MKKILIFCGILATYLFIIGCVSDSGGGSGDTTCVSICENLGGEYVEGEGFFNCSLLETSEDYANCSAAFTALNGLCYFNSGNSAPSPMSPLADPPVVIGAQVLGDDSSCVCNEVGTCVSIE